MSQQCAKCVSPTCLLRQLNVLPHPHTNCSSNWIFQQVTVWVSWSPHWLYNARPRAGWSLIEPLGLQHWQATTPGSPALIEVGQATTPGSPALIEVGQATTSGSPALQASALSHSHPGSNYWQRDCSTQGPEGRDSWKPPDVVCTGSNY